MHSLTNKYTGTAAIVCSILFRSLAQLTFFSTFNLIEDVLLDLKGQLLITVNFKATCKFTNLPKKKRGDGQLKLNVSINSDMTKHSET